MTVWLDVNGKRRRVDLPGAALQSASAMRCQVDGRAIDVDVRLSAQGVLSLIVDGRQFRCLLDRDLDGDAVLIAGRRHPFTIRDPRSLSGQNGAIAGADGPRSVRAPMPGRVVRVLVAAGDLVEEHQGLVVIEAMKMQNELKSPKAGRVARFAADVGATVAAGDTLAIIE